MAYITVTTPIDVVAPGDGKLSLREAVAKANATVAPDTIVFAADIAGMTLTLTQGELQVTQDLAIDGDQDNNDNAVTIDGNANGRIMRTVVSGANLALENWCSLLVERPRGVLAEPMAEPFSLEVAALPWPAACVSNSRTGWLWSRRWHLRRTRQPIKYSH